uniref:Uncharacterized protein n=1 Tax=Rhodopseudomonas palustris (strain BisA53) TaxID=316055 RepID=Q07N72_RHOP5
MQAGVGANGPDNAKLASLYLDPANLAVTCVPLAEQKGKVARTYEEELAGWLKERHGFAGTVEGALVCSPKPVNVTSFPSINRGPQPLHCNRIEVPKCVLVVQNQ